MKLKLLALLLILASPVYAATIGDDGSVSAGGGGGAVTVGGSLSGGTNTRVLFDDSGTIGEDSGLTYNKTTDILTVVGGVATGASTDPCMTFDTSSAGDNDMWLGMTSDNGGTSASDYYQFGTGTTCGSNVLISIDTGTTAPMYGLNTTAPGSRLDINTYGTTFAFTSGNANNRIGFATNADARTGIEVRNDSTGTSASTGFAATDSNKSVYLSLQLSGSGATYTRYGNQANTQGELTLSGARNLAIGTVTSGTSVYVATGNTTRATVDANGVTITGTIRSSRTTDLGWAVVAGAATACNTTCTNACVFGQDTATMAIVACTDASADVCLCAGAN